MGAASSCRREQWDRHPTLTHKIAATFPPRRAFTNNCVGTTQYPHFCKHTPPPPPPLRPLL